MMNTIFLGADLDVPFLVAPNAVEQPWIPGGLWFIRHCEHLPQHGPIGQGNIISFSSLHIRRPQPESVNAQISRRRGKYDWITNHEATVIDDMPKKPPLTNVLLVTNCASVLIA